MYKTREQIKDLLAIIEQWQRQNGATYTQMLPLNSKGYKRWYNNVKRERVVTGVKEYYDFSSWVLLPVHLERAYEILVDKDILSMNELHEFRKGLVKWYVKDLRKDDPPNIRPDIQGDSFEEIVHKAHLYGKIIEFYSKGQAEESITPYISEALKHIEAMAAKIELDLAGVDDYGGKFDKDVLVSLARAYSSLADEHSGEDREKMDRRAKAALKQIELLFNDEDLVKAEET